MTTENHSSAESPEAETHSTWIYYLLLIPLSFSIVLFRLLHFSRSEFEHCVDMFWNVKIDSQ